MVAFRRIPKGTSFGVFQGPERCSKTRMTPLYRRYDGHCDANWNHAHECGSYGGMIERELIYLWRVRLDSEAYDAEQIARWRSLLSTEELRKADSFHAEGHRRDYAAAHAALRTVLGGYLGIPAGGVQFAV